MMSDLNQFSIIENIGFLQAEIMRNQRVKLIGHVDELGLVRLLLLCAAIQQLLRLSQQPVRLKSIPVELNQTTKMNSGKMYSNIDTYRPSWQRGLGTTVVCCVHSVTCKSLFF